MSHGPLDLGLVALAALSWFLRFLVWRRQRDVFEASGWVPVMLGDHARPGFNATMGFMASPFSVVAVASLADSFLPEGPLREAMDWVGFTRLLGGFAFCGSILLFLRPRPLVPPHLRERRGWVREAIASSRFSGRSTRD